MFTQWLAERRQREQNESMKCMARNVAWQFEELLHEAASKRLNVVMNASPDIMRALNLMSRYLEDPEDLSDDEMCELTALTKLLKERLSEACRSSITIANMVLPVVNESTGEDMELLQNHVLEHLRHRGAHAIQSDVRPNGSLWFHVTFTR